MKSIIKGLIKIFCISLLLVGVVGLILNYKVNNIVTKHKEELQAIAIVINESGLSNGIDLRAAWKNPYQEIDIKDTPLNIYKEINNHLIHIQYSYLCNKLLFDLETHDIGTNITYDEKVAVYKDLELADFNTVTEQLDNMGNKLKDIENKYGTFLFMTQYIENAVNNIDKIAFTEDEYIDLRGDTVKTIDLFLDKQDELMDKLEKPIVSGDEKVMFICLEIINNLAKLFCVVFIAIYLIYLIVTLVKRKNKFYE